MEPVRRKVQKVIDGDTFKVHKNIGGSQYIRIANYDAPEKRQIGYQPAKRALKQMEGEVVTIYPVARDRGRIVANVYKNRGNIVKKLKK